MNTNFTGRTANLANGFSREIKSILGIMPKSVIILGSGLGEAVENSKSFSILGELKLNGLPFADLPSFTADSHKLKMFLVEENFSKEKLVVVCGRKHLYEIEKDSDDLKEVVRIPRALALAGVENFYHTSAVGGINPSTPGSLIFVTDHDGSELIPRGLFTGSDGSKFGPMFFDCSGLYNNTISLKTVNKHSTKGTLQWHVGPMFETPAQIKRLSSNGIAGVGMSMLPEVLSLKQISLTSGFENINNIGIGVVANAAAGIGKPITHEEVKKIMKRAAPKLMEFIAAIITERSNLV